MSNETSTDIPMGGIVLILGRPVSIKAWALAKQLSGLPFDPEVKEVHRLALAVQAGLDEGHRTPGLESDLRQLGSLLDQMADGIRNMQRKI